MRLQVIVSYNGTNYAGWQIQPAALTIQKVLHDILATMHRHPVMIVGSGRTDAGVHALGQSFHFDTDMTLSNEAWAKALNAQLPDDIVVRSVKEVADDFHARFSAVSKRYDYLVNTGEYNPFQFNLAYQLNKDLDLDRMRQGAALLVGTHDFSSFCANSFEEIPDQTRTITRLDINKEEDIVRFILEGNGFLRYMVRMLVGNLIEVGLHKKDIEELANIMKQKDKLASNSIAPACGLYLIRVDYKDHP